MIYVIMEIIYDDFLKIYIVLGKYVEGFLILLENIILIILGLIYLHFYMSFCYYYIFFYREI